MNNSYILNDIFAEILPPVGLSAIPSTTTCNSVQLTWNTPSNDGMVQRCKHFAVWVLALF